MNAVIEQKDVESLAVINVESLDAFHPVQGDAVQRWVTDLGKGSCLEALGVNRGTDTLVVSLHGATNRSKYRLPRFEWLATLSGADCSSLYFSDPTLRINKELELGWYTGWPGFNGHFWLAEWTRRVAEEYGCTRIIFAGSSGGGMASLQASTYIPESMALVFNPQTSIIKYLVGGERDHAQRRYFNGVVPHLLPGGWSTKDSVGDWTEPLGDLVSPVKKYSSPHENYVYYVQNENDLPHVNDHYKPFRNAVESYPQSGTEESKFHFELYLGPDGHVVPSREQYLGYLMDARAWLDLRL